MITHYDLFAGIGGFSVAVDEVFKDEPTKHIFCEWEHFPTQVLKKHWPDGEYWGDIAELVAHTENERLERPSRKEQTNQSPAGLSGLTILTGGFPCQPFSAAGRRRGTSDDRYKWPEMFEVIRNVQPEWVIAENVRGLTNWSDGLVLEQICTDLEGEGYEVQPLIIPAVAKNAPHRRDRVWIIGRKNVDDTESGGRRVRQREYERQGEGDVNPLADTDKDAQDPISQRSRGRGENSEQVLERQKPEVQAERPDSQTRNAPDSQHPGLERRDWSTNWPEVAAELCVVDDGLSSQLVRLPDGTKISYPKWRKESLKAGGNAIVPQVAIEILRAIKEQL